MVLLVVDVTVGVTDEDLAAARVARRQRPRRCSLVANKVDDAGREAAAWEFVSLGLGDPWPVSALHGRGTGDLLDEVVRLLGRGRRAPPAASEASDDGPQVDRRDRRSASAGTVPQGGAGRPARTSGKSTLFNRLVGEERSIVHDMPGTTRDAIDTVVETPDGPLCFVDTAGMRRPSKTDRGTEHHSVLRALDALDGADIALLVIDATVGATHQDQRLAERIGASGCPAVVVLNKWDLVAHRGPRGRAGRGGGPAGVPRHGPGAAGLRATTGRGVHRILPALLDAVEAYHHRIPTGALNRALRDIQASPRRAGGAHPLRRAGRDRPADVHAVRHGPAAADLPPLRRATSCASTSTSGRRRSSCACAPAVAGNAGG